jgi:large subunit ribosomal protein L30
MLRIRLAKSPIGNTARNRATVKALGLRKVHQIVEHDDSPAIRGMIHRVKHLLAVETVDGEVSKKKEVAKPAPAKPEPKQPEPVKAAKAEKVDKPAKAEKVEKPASEAPKPAKKAAPKKPKSEE